MEKYPRPIKRRSASAMASGLRQSGYKLKKFTPQSQRRKAEAKRVKEVALKLRGLGATYAELGILMGVSKQAVHQRLNEND